MEKSCENCSKFDGNDCEPNHGCCKSDGFPYFKPKDEYPLTICDFVEGKEYVNSYEGKNFIYRLVGKIVQCSSTHCSFEETVNSIGTLIKFRFREVPAKQEKRKWYAYVCKNFCGNDFLCWSSNPDLIETKYTRKPEFDKEEKE